MRCGALGKFNFTLRSNISLSRGAKISHRVSDISLA
jgi:hypothetical protein